MVRKIVAQRGGENVNEYEVDITQLMRDRALAFASKIKIDDNQFSRLLPTDLRERTPGNIIKILKLEIQRTYVGKLGEIAFLMLLKERGVNFSSAEMFQIYEGQANTDDFDFITSDGKSVDIKTGFRSNHTRLLVNMQQFNRIPKDYYVGVKLNARDVPGDQKLIYWDSVRTATVKGYISKTSLNEINEENFSEANAKHIKYNELMGIDSLLDMF